MNNPISPEQAKEKEMLLRETRRFIGLDNLESKIEAAKGFFEPRIVLVVQLLIESLSSEQALRETIESHAPEGRNYTNGQYVNLLLKHEALQDQLNQAVEEIKLARAHINVNGRPDDADKVLFRILSSRSQSKEKTT